MWRCVYDFFGVSQVCIGALLVLVNSVGIEYIGKHDLVYICQYLGTKRVFLPVPSFIQYPCDHHEFLLKPVVVN